MEVPPNLVDLEEAKKQLRKLTCSSHPKFKVACLCIFPSCPQKFLCLCCLLEDYLHSRKHAECIISCSEYISTRASQGYSQCKTELAKKQTYIEKFSDSKTDMSTSMEEIIKLIEQDYSSLKAQLVLYLDTAKEKLSSKAENVLKTKLKEVNDSIEKLSVVKSFDDVKKSQADQAAALRKELEQTPIADEVLFHKIYNCINAYSLEEKLAKTSMQEAEDSRKQFKSKKFELFCGIFQDYQLNQKEDIKKLQEILNEFYDQKKKTEVKSIFKEKIDKVFTSDIEAQQVDSKPVEMAKSQKLPLVSPVKLLGTKNSQATEAMMVFTQKLCRELGFSLDSSKAQTLVAMPVIAKLLGREMDKRKEEKERMMEKERHALKEAQKRKELLAKEATVKQNLDALKKKKEQSRDKILGIESSFTDHYVAHEHKADTISSGQLIQAAKSLIISKKQPEISENEKESLNPKIAEVDNLLSKLSMIQLHYTQDQKEVKRLEKLSDLVIQKREETHSTEISKQTYPPTLNSRVQVQSTGLEFQESLLQNLLQPEKPKQSAYQPQPAARRENSYRDQNKNYGHFKENSHTNDTDRRWNQNSKPFDNRNYMQKPTQRHEHPLTHRENRNKPFVPNIEFQENGAMQVIQTMVLNSPAETHHPEQHPDRAHRSNLAKRPPHRSTFGRGEPEDQLHFTTEESNNILRPSRTNVPPSAKEGKSFQITPDCKVLPYRLRRSDEQAMVHEHYSEFQLSKGNCFYFTGAEPTDFIEALLQKEAFVSSVLVEPPKLTHDHNMNLAKVNGAALYTFRNEKWEKISNLEFKGQTQIVVPVNMRASVFRIAHGKSMDPTSALGIGRLTVMG